MAREFQEWVLNALHNQDYAALCSFLECAPNARKAHPTWEHFAPLLFAAGAACASKETVQELYSAWTFGNLSMAALGWETK